MKKTYRLITTCSVCCAICAATIALSSCKFEQEDYFPESASLRITHVNEEIKDRLVEQSAEGSHGWLIQYFVAGTDDYNFEGFNIFGRFYKSGRVTLAGNHRFLRNNNANKYTEHDSHYEMLAEEGPVLSFNTWNDVLTVLEDPVSPTAAPGSIVADGEGMRGDHNFVLTKFEDDCITFRGERHGANSRFTPCDRPWEEYMEAAEKTKKDITSDFLTSYYVTNATDTMYFVGLKKGYFNYCDRVSDPLNNKVLSCVFTPEGFRLHRIYYIESNMFQEFKMSPDSTCLVSESDSVRVIACWDNYIVNVRNTVWNFDQEQLSEEQKSILEQLDTEIKKVGKTYSLASIGLGRSTGKGAVNGLVITFYTNSAKSKSNTAGLELNTTRPVYGKMNIEAAEDAAMDGNLTSLAARSNAGELMKQFAATLISKQAEGKTQKIMFDITPNNYFKPTGCELQEILIDDNGKETPGTAKYTLK